MSQLLKRLKKYALIALVVIAIIFGAMYLLSNTKNQVGNVSLGLLTAKDIKIEHLIDPKVKGVTCYIAHVKGDFDMIDPSNTSISCRQTGEITMEQLKGIDMSDDGEVVFEASKSIFFKTMKIRRIYDKRSRTLLYLSYSSTEINGDYEHSLSTVPLFGNPVWAQMPAINEK